MARDAYELRMLQARAYGPDADIDSDVAAVSFTVSDQYPDELSAAYERGTGVQFVLDEQDDEVVVFVDR